MKRIIVPLLLLIYMVGCGTGKSGGNLEISADVNFGKNDYLKIVSPNNILGFKVLSEVSDDSNSNVFISPTSLMIALSMVYNGADGETKDEIAKVLQNEGIDIDELNKANASLMTMLNKDSDQIELHVANSIWLNEDFHFENDFAQNNNDYFNAELQEINVLDNNSPKKINDWVKNATNKKIEEIVDSPLDKDLVAVLINAIYFNGNWKYEFNEKLTDNRDFFTDENNKVVVPLMTLDEELAYLEKETFQAVSLPYGDGEVSMKIFLPNENISLKEFEQTLTNENWKVWNTEFRKKEGTLLLPKFQLEYEVILNDALMKLGMDSAFDRDTANFTKMIKEDDPVWISNVKQKTYIDVHEKGTEAAAVTSIEMKTTSAPIDGPFYMEVNRPFFIAITDDETDTILFMGSIYNPEKGK